MKHVNKFLVMMLVVLSWTAKAQVQELTRHAEVVIEGEVISTESKWNDERNLIMTENKVLVKSVFKGQIQDYVISVLTTGGIIDEHFHYKTHEINMTNGEDGYFFLTPDYSSNSNYFSDERYGFVRVHGTLNKFTSVFGSKGSINDFEEQIIQETKFPKLDFEKHYEIFSIQAFGDRDTCDLLPLTRNIKSIEFTFDSVMYTPDLQYLEFDIMAKVNTPGLKFGKGDLFIRYDKAFGENVVTKGSVEITKGEIIQNSLFDLQYDDYSENIIYVSADSEFGSNQMYTFTSTAAELLHIKVKIDDFTQIGSVSFDSIDISGSVYYWCQGNYNLFDQINLDDPISAVSSSTPIGLTYTFENVSVDPSNTTMSADVFAEATNTSLYSDAFIYINYNELGFGSNVVSNSNVSFQQTDLLNDLNVYQTFLYDHDQNTIQLVVFAPSENGLSTLGTTPQKLGTLRFDIIDCDKEKELHFEPLTETSDHIHYTGAMPIPWELYDPVIAEDEETGTICGCSKPTITSFEGPNANNPNVIHGGVGEILTIKGNNFGTYVPIESTVIFKNGDDMGPSEIEVGVSDFKVNNVIEWTDTQIKLILPGCDKSKGVDQPPSSGRFKVRNPCDVSDESPNPIDIPYSVYTFRSLNHGKVKRLNLQANGDNNSICFNFSKDLPVWIQNEFESALNSWCGETGINFTIGDRIDKNTPLGAIDNTNLVSFEGGSSGGHLASAVYFEDNNCNNNDELFFSEIDFILRSNVLPTQNPTSAQQEQMREVIKHELGHAHMLNHAKGFGQLMHPNGNSGIGGTITTNDSEGANLVFNSSNACGLNPIFSGQCANSCGGTNSIETITNTQLGLYPNPTDDLLTIQIDEQIYLLEIFDHYGRLCLSSKNPPKSIDVKHLISGIYIIKVYSTSSESLNKFIKL